ncbi:hypothetical protein LTR84_001034 [Exophiala bonariae]|uniref:Protein kinase domain-containing protein n=1 Tax=Exophiala bonariae TaxID=1690606 RepID=A0AAV9NVP8_9EURO|nr:hypothetical protein LTR84_001034 [Exophiala bonariae]
MDEFEWVKSFATSSYGTVNDASLPAAKDSVSSPAPTSRGSFASFVCHVARLESKLRSFSSLVLDDSSDVKATGKILGQGKTFMVRHAKWVRNPKEPPLEVALKEIIPDVKSSDGTSRPHTDWKDILFELRALLHEPIRYHPNLVRLLGIQWGLSPIADSTYPVLIMEYASLGTFKTLQTSSEPLSFPVKQKLCYDVGRALSALHASGIVHGDMKHENVLIFPSKKPIDGIAYTAKLADFGGTVMDLVGGEVRKKETWTWPFQAPEVTNDQALTRNGLMLTDVYSFGLLVWRAFLDGEGFVSLPGAAQTASDQDRRALNAHKASEELTNIAVIDIYDYAKSRGLSQACLDMMVYTVLHTVQLKPENRELVKAQAALRGIVPGHIPNFMEFVHKKNEERQATEARAAPGRHGISRDSLQFMLGRYGNDADLQDNLPGFRPRLDEPNPEEFMFEPASLKNILTWEQQRQMLDEMKAVAGTTTQISGGLLEMPKTVAAFYVFQCYLLEFGTNFNPDEAVAWLLKASSDDDSHEDQDYFAQAWVWRVSRALGVPANIPPDRLRGLLNLSVIRGHRTALLDMLELMNISSGPERQQWWNAFQQFRNILQCQMGAVGMGYYFSKYLTRPWNTVNLNNTTEVDEAIRTCVGSDYNSCLRCSASVDQISSSQQGRDKEQTTFDRIYINQRGHGLLHMAAATGATDTLRHLVTKYDCDINIPNQHVDESPLVCACEGGQSDSAILLLEHGADPNGYRFSQEGPLHWLCSFLPNEMEKIASRLVRAGADIELRSGGMRHDVRGIRADWEHNFEIRTTPLGRAVLMNNLDAVKVLLKLGANPLAKSASKHPGEYEGMQDFSKLIDVSSPFELAAVLTLPHILAELIKHIDGPSGTPRLKLLDEWSMLDLAHGNKVTEFDSVSLQSRLVRCGMNYKRNMRDTLVLLHTRDRPFRGISGDEVQKQQSRVLFTEVALGNLDVVEILLELGYSSNGTQDFRPLQKAVERNHEEMFWILVRYRVDMNVTIMTPTGGISMLHVAAMRPQQSRPGRVIADALIRAGVPVESTDPRTRPPLAMAIMCQNFEVAGALLENGANIDAIYPLSPNALTGTEETKAVGVLVEVLSQHTMRTLESLKFIFGQRDGGPSQRPAFHIDPGNKLSILHLLAGSPQFTQIAQITPKILNLCLATYADPALINYRHPFLGTALYYAAMCGHKTMVELLLEHGADETHKSGPDVDGSVQTLFRPEESWSPLWAAILKFEDELRKGIHFPPEGPPGAWLSSNSIQNAEKIIGLLSANGQKATAQRAITQLKARKQALELKTNAWQKDRMAKRREYRAQEDEAPIDLGILSGDGSKDDEAKIREICRGPEQEWKTERIESFLGSLSLEE